MLRAVRRKQSDIFEIKKDFNQEPHLGKLACIVIVRHNARGVRGDGTTRDWPNRLYARGLRWRWTVCPCAAMYTPPQHSIGKACCVMCWRGVK